jgi:hypothetical protein
MIAGRRFVGFLTPPSRDNNFVRNRRQRRYGTWARLTISSKLLALAKIVHDDDRLKAE